MTPAEDPSPDAGRLGHVAAWPGVRTFRSARFRLALAAVLWLGSGVVVASLLARQAADPGGQYGLDFAAYRAASLAMAEGRSPYRSELDRPIQAGTEGAYLYPPAFAQALTPLAALPAPVAATAWLAIQVVLFYAAIWVAGTAGGARATLERFCWSGVALWMFLPVFDTLWKGNVEGPLALAVVLVAAAGRRLPGVAGTVLAVAVWLKLSPLALVPVALRGDRRLSIGLLIGSAAIVVPSLLLAPGAWADYARVLPDLLVGSSVYTHNLAPASLVVTWGGAPALAGPVRLAALAIGVTAIVAAVGLAGRSSGWAASVVLGVVALLLLPSALWYHYLALILPLTALAWPAAGPAERLAMFASGAAVSAGIAFLPLASASAAIMAAATLWALRPGRAATVWYGPTARAGAPSSVTGSAGGA